MASSPAKGTGSQLQSPSNESGDVLSSKEANSKRFAWLQNLPKGNPPAIFSELGIQAKNILYKGFSPGFSLSLAKLTPVGQVQLSTTKMEDSVLGLAGATTVVPPGAMLEISAASTKFVQSTLSWNLNGPGFSAVLAGTFPPTAQATATYRHQHFTTQAKGQLAAQAPIDLSLTLGGVAGDLTIGAQGSFNPNSKAFSELNAGIGMSQGNVTALAVYDLQHQKALDFVVSQALDDKLSVAAEYKRSMTGNPDIITYGLQYQPDPRLMVKGRFDNHGKVAALLQHEFIPNSTISIQAEWEVDKQGRQTKPNIGVSATIFA